jgi:carbon storage regulator
MLVLTRKIGEAIRVGDEVTIEVLEVRGGRVRLGITAPSDVGVHRSELLVSASEWLESVPQTPTGWQPKPTVKPTNSTPPDCRRGVIAF